MHHKKVIVYKLTDIVYTLLLQIEQFLAFNFFLQPFFAVFFYGTTLILKIVEKVLCSSC